MDSFWVSLWSIILSFFDSNFFVALVTGGVAFVAVFVYKKQQHDQKSDAASIIFQEIKNAEAQLAQAKEIFLKDKAVPESIFLMKTSSWEKYGYLFIRNFTSEEWQLVNNFYNKCKQYDEVVEYSNTFFKKNEEQVRVNLHQSLANYTSDLVSEIREIIENHQDDQKIQDEMIQDAYKEYNNSISTFYDEFIGQITSYRSKYFYSPDKPFKDAEVLLHTIRQDLSIGTIGVRLESLMKANRRSSLKTLLN